MVGACKVAPHWQATLSPAWNVSIAILRPQRHGSKYFSPTGIVSERDDKHSWSVQQVG
jgi:hypothetical protein